MKLTSWLGDVAQTARHLDEARRRRAPIAFLDQRWAHHGRRSGYLIVGELGPRVARSDRALPGFIVRAGAKRSGDPLWEQRWLLWATLALGRATLLHVVDGDFDTWVYRSRPAWVRARVTATFHQPVDRIAEVTRGLQPGPLDGSVSVAGPNLRLPDTM